MAYDPKYVHAISAYFDTRRRIKAIERKALQKVAKEPPNVLLEECSFCGNSETEVDLLIYGDKEARICSDCCCGMAALLSAPKDD